MCILRKREGRSLLASIFSLYPATLPNLQSGGKSTIYEITEKQKEAESVMKNVFGFELTDYTKKLCEYLCGMIYERIPDEVL